MFVCFVETSRPNKLVNQAEIAGKNVSQILQDHGQSHSFLIIHTPTFAEPLDRKTIPIDTYPGLVINSDIAKYQRPSYYLEISPKYWYSVTVSPVVENIGALPPYKVVFTNPPYSSLSSRFFKTKLIKGLDLEITKAEIYAGDDLLPDNVYLSEIIQLAHEKTIFLHVSLSNGGEDRLSIRSNVINSIVGSETKFVKGLNTIITQVRQRFQEANIISAEDQDTLFRNLPELIERHQQFLDLLNDRMDGYSTRLADAFLNFVDMYLDDVQYIESYPEISEILNVLEEQKPLKKQIEDIRDIMETPLSHYSQYINYVRNLLNSTPNSHPDHPLLRIAIDLIKTKTEEISQRVEVIQQQAILLRLQQKMSNMDFIKEGRKFITRRDVTIDDGTPGTILLFNDLIMVIKEDENESHDVFHCAIDQIPDIPVQFSSNEEEDAFMKEVKFIRRSIMLQDKNMFTFDWEKLHMPGISKCACVATEKVYYAFTKDEIHIIHGDEIIKHNHNIDLGDYFRVTMNNNRIFLITSSNILKFDPYSIQSTIVASFPPRINFSVMFALNSIYIFGGETDQGEKLNELIIFDTGKGELRITDTGVEAKSNHDAAYYDDYMLVVGDGENILRYDLLSSNWETIEIPDLVPRLQTHAFIIGGFMILMGGELSIEAIDLETFEVSIVHEYGQLPASLTDFDAYVLPNEKILVITSESVYTLTPPTCIREDIEANQKVVHTRNNSSSNMKSPSANNVQQVIKRRRTNSFNQSPMKSKSSETNNFSKSMILDENIRKQLSPLPMPHRRHPAVMNNVFMKSVILFDDNERIKRHQKLRDQGISPANSCAFDFFDNSDDDTENEVSFYESELFASPIRPYRRPVLLDEGEYSYSEDNDQEQSFSEPELIQQNNSMRIGNTPKRLRRKPRKSTDEKMSRRLKKQRFIEMGDEMPDLHELSEYEDEEFEYDFPEEAYQFLSDDENESEHQMETRPRRRRIGIGPIVAVLALAAAVLVLGVSRRNIHK